ncbi:MULTISPECIES: hypothetical protein [Cyanophyceae]|uniref:hypothetical protein n=1 Tax=Cyanophyceae TaxID=3028117 RepID=UPI0018EFDCE6|nr:hypothetical protein [Trichocoleus sp. FACHB-69]
MPNIRSQMPPFALPEVVPETLPQQQFQLGDLVRWRQVPHPDFGRILGVIYTHSSSCIATGLHYLVLLDEQSPSRHITSYDFAFEEDIERLNQSSVV